MEKFLILDSNSILHRSFHALPRLTTKKGELVNAIYGFLLVLFKVIKEFQPDYVCACFDFPAKTFRHEKFKEYKAQRPPCPKDLANQIPKLKEILNAFKIPVFEKEGYEADDLIGTTVVKSQGLEKIIISGDLDNLQLVSKETKVFVLSGTKKSTLYDEEEVKKKYQGLKPEQIPDFKALVGDPSDNIPGVVGIGEKTAIKLLLEFGNLENLYKEIEESSERAKGIKPKIKELLLNSKEKIFFSKNLVQIKKDVPFDFDLKKCRLLKPDSKKVIKILKDFEFYSLIKRLSDFQKSKQNDKIKEVEANRQKALF
jgi:DNA polymerase-1